jgi:two-component system LytT family sensor kinase
MRTPWRLLVIAWPVLSVLYTLILVGNAEWPWLQGAILGGLTIGVALLLGVPVWHLTERVPIPDRVRPGFVLIHLGAAVLFSLLWLAIDMSLAAVFLPHQLHLRKIASMGWETILGVWVYGVIAAASYTARARHAAALVRQASEVAESRAVRAELDALRARLNPHFLFNALHSLGGLARDDLARFDRAVDHLGDLLREAIRPGAAALVPLSDDLAFAERFLAFEHIRLGDRLHVEVDVDDAALDALVPSMLLQPLVENAVRHGIDPKPGGSTIRIGARVEEQVLHIAVEDNGAGLAESGVERNGVGLGALQERLARMYPEQALVVEGGSAGGCIVHVRIPA